MKNLFLIIVTIGILLLFSCSENPNNIIEYIPDNYTKSIITLDSLVDELQVITFSNQVSLVKSNELKWCDPYFYYAIPSQGKIYRFLENGDYVDVLDRRGRGSSEYSVIADFFVDGSTGNIFVSTNNKKIMVYNSDLDYIYNIDYPEPRDGTMKVRWLNNNIHVFYYNYSGTGFDWIKIDTIGNVIDSRKCSETHKLPFMPYDLQLFENNGSLFRFNYRSDTIFKIDNIGYYPYRIINQDFKDGFNFADGEIWNNPLQFNGLRSDKRHREIKAIHGIGNYWLMEYNKMSVVDSKKVHETVLYDYNNNVLHLVNSTSGMLGQSLGRGLINDIFSLNPFSVEFTIRMNNQDYIGKILDAIDFKRMSLDQKELRGSSSASEIGKIIEIAADSMEIDDNPVLILLRLK